MSKRKGKFITFEGPEGSGKSTQLKKTARYLRSKGCQVVWTREPGGTVIGEKIRRILLSAGNKDMVLAAEMLLYMAARAQLIEEEIRPALSAGKIVMADRFLDATIAYQGYAGGLDIGLIKKIGRLAVNNIKPDLTLLFDLPAAKGLSRLKGDRDRIEQRAIAYHRRVRKGYLTLARQEPKRIKIIPVKGNADQVYQRVKEVVDKCLSAG